MRTSLASLTVLCAVLVSDPCELSAQGAPAAAEGFVVEAGSLYRVSGGARTALALPGSARAVHVAGDRAYVALGELGALVLRVERSGAAEQVIVEKLIPVSHGEVTGFLVEGDAVWMQVSSSTAIRLGGGAGSLPVAPVVAPPSVVPAGSEPPRPAPVVQPPATEEPELAGIAIVKVFDGQVLLNRGTSSGLRSGDRFKVIRKEQLSDEGGTFDGEQEVGVLVVESISADSARARVWRGDRVQVGDRVERADANTDPSLMYPRQLHGFVEAELHLRPLLNVGAAAQAC